MVHMAAPLGASVARGTQPDLDPATVVATIDGHAITAPGGRQGDLAAARSARSQVSVRQVRAPQERSTRCWSRGWSTPRPRKRATTRGRWLKKHVEESTPEASEADAKKFYDENSAEMGGRSFDQEKPHIIAFLTNQKRQEAAGKIFDALKSKAKVEILLEEPAVNVEAVGPSMGPANAPVTIVEFSDFQCPFCSKVEPTIKRVMADYAGKVRFVFRDYPLPFHEHAQKAAEASHCAEAQRKYWPMHDAHVRQPGQARHRRPEEARGERWLEWIRRSSTSASTRARTKALVASNDEGGRSGGRLGHAALLRKRALAQRVRSRTRSSRRPSTTSWRGARRLQPWGGSRDGRARTCLIDDDVSLRSRRKRKPPPSSALGMGRQLIRFSCR